MFRCSETSVKNQMDFGLKNLKAYHLHAKHLSIPALHPRMYKVKVILPSKWSIQLEKGQVAKCI